MGFIRPELAERLNRWREPLAWATLLVAGLWLIWRGYVGLAPLSFAVGLVCAAAGAGLLRAALRRLRFRAAVTAAGVVVIDEGRIGYLGPFGGGFADIPALVSVEIVAAPAPLWILACEDGTRLAIPLGAEGAEGLYDALSLLPGIDFDAALPAIDGGARGRFELWRRAPQRRSPQRLR